jgi:hypothetical protein
LGNALTRADGSLSVMPNLLRSNPWRQRMQRK